MAAALGIQRANFVALLDGLERRGLARRGPTPNDRRCHALHLTAEGERMLTLASARVVAIEARLDEKLGPGGARAAARHAVAAGPRMAVRLSAFKGAHPAYLSLDLSPHISPISAHEGGLGKARAGKPIVTLIHAPLARAYAGGLLSP